MSQTWKQLPGTWEQIPEVSHLALARGINCHKLLNTDCREKQGVTAKQLMWNETSPQFIPEFTLCKATEQTQHFAQISARLIHFPKSLKVNEKITLLNMITRWKWRMDFLWREKVAFFPASQQKTLLKENEYVLFLNTLNNKLIHNA